MSDDSVERALTKLRKNAADGDAWEDLYRLTWPYTLATMYRLLNGNRLLAEEASQETMLRLVRNVRFDRENTTAASYYAYLRQICSSVATDIRRRSVREVPFGNDVSELPEEAVEDQRATPERDAMLRSLVDHVRAKLEPEEEKIARMLADGYSAHDIAQRTNSSLATAYRRIASVRERIREALRFDAGTA